MVAPVFPTPNIALNLALAVVGASNAPLLLLDGDLTIVAASSSFCSAFEIDPSGVVGSPVFTIGAGEWDLPQLRSLLGATVSGGAEIPAYEIDLASGRRGVRRLVLNARKLDYGDPDHVRLLLAVADVTDARIAERLKDDLLREKSMLLQEVQHRVANSLQIIASLLMQSARKVQSEETRGHLRAAHGRVMSIAALQQQLAASSVDEVALRPYLTQLCMSLGASMIAEPAELAIEVRSDDRSVKPDMSVSLGLIVTELVINALKHAFSDGRSGRIMVDYRSRGEDWTLSVGDDGIGMPPESETAKPGLGTSIVRALARQLDADISMAAANPGTTVSIAHVDLGSGAANANAAEIAI